MPISNILNAKPQAWGFVGPTDHCVPSNNYTASIGQHLKQQFDLLKRTNHLHSIKKGAISNIWYVTILRLVLKVQVFQVQL